MKKIFLPILCSLLTFCGPGPDYKYNIGTFPETPVNMGSLNSEYDDYNSSSPVLGDTSPLCFSSNRNSKGKNYDIVYKLLDVFLLRETGELIVRENNETNLDVYTQNSNLINAVTTANSSSNELGPYLIPGNILLYASDKSGNLDIKFTHNKTGNYTDPKDISFLNSEKDDAYPALTADSAKLYFCSNRESSFDIYNATLDPANTLLEELTYSTTKTITKDTTLSSTFNDKCPYIMKSLLVFVSDRPGGYGGFDLYYSVFKDGKWSKPVNFGDKINTPYDEYRPIVKDYGYEFTNNFMIFSSNRPGGKGGFDLYYVGTDKIAE